MLAGLFLIPSGLRAQDAAKATPVVTRRQVRQQARIKQGVKSGELTKKEAAQLEHEQGKIRRTKRRAKADGVVTRKERAHLQHEQNKASRDIYRKKHNAQTQN